MTLVSGRKGNAMLKSKYSERHRAPKMVRNSLVVDVAIIFDNLELSCICTSELTALQMTRKLWEENQEFLACSAGSPLHRF